VPQEVYTLTADASRFEFDGTRGVPRRVTHTIVNRHGIMRSRIDFEPEVFGRSGTTVIMPVPKTPGRPNPNPPPGSTLPPKPQPPRYAPILISATPNP
jgi:hypothetical protein